MELDVPFLFAKASVYIDVPFSFANNKKGAIRKETHTYPHPRTNTSQEWYR
jgi:hypothetical protein